MIYLLFGLGLFLYIIGTLVNEKNAGYLFAGHNTLTKEEQQAFNLSAYLKRFRKFHQFLGISFILFGLLLYYLFGEYAALLFLVCYPILAYVYFLFQNQTFSSPKQRKRNGIAALVLILVLLGVLALFFYEGKANEFTVENNRIEIKGSYGEGFDLNEMKSIQWVTSLPPIRMKVNGFSAGGISKGMFKTEDGQKLKLIVDKNQPHFLHITKKDGAQIYYSASEEEKGRIYQLLAASMTQSVEELGG